MKSVIPFTKELDFSTKVKEITSISLEREFEVDGTSVVGNLFVTGDYKSHEVSANVIPFSFKIPFTIEIPEHIIEDSIVLEISDFAYDMEENSKIKVSIELELSGEEEIPEEVEDEPEEVIEIDPDEILRMMEESAKEEIIEEEENDRVIEIEEPDEVKEDVVPKENKDESRKVEEVEPQEEIIEAKEEIVEEKEEVVEVKETPNVADDRNDNIKESEEMIIQNAREKEDEYTTYHIHIVKEGETVETICTMYNSNLSMLSEYNDMNEIVTGVKLIIPDNAES